MSEEKKYKTEGIETICKQRSAITVEAIGGRIVISERDITGMVGAYAEIEIYPEHVKQLVEMIEKAADNLKMHTT